MYQTAAHVLSLSATGSSSWRWGICTSPTSGATCFLLSPGPAPRQASRPPCTTALHHPTALAHSLLLFGTGHQAINTQKAFFYIAAPEMTLFTFMDGYVDCKPAHILYCYLVACLFLFFYSFEKNSFSMLRSSLYGHQQGPVVTALADQKRPKAESHNFSQEVRV